MTEDKEYLTLSESHPFGWCLGEEVKEKRIWPVGQAVKTPPFHGGNMGSSPVRVTSKKAQELSCAFLLCPYGKGDEPIGFGKMRVSIHERFSLPRLTP